MGDQTDAPQRTLINRARTVVAGDDRILAAWLIGSFATGEADCYSDVDLHCLITDESADWFRSHWSEVATEIAGPLALADDLPGLIGGVTLTPDWVHLDLILHPRSDFDLQAVEVLTPVYDRLGVLFARSEPLGVVLGDPYFPRTAVNEFLYLTGSLVKTLGRGELIVAQGSIIAVRERLIQLMLAERGIQQSGSNKRLNRLLSNDQRECLESIPPAGASVVAISDAAQAISREFVRRGKALADRTGATWPQALEDAMAAHLQRHLGASNR